MPVALGTAQQDAFLAGPLAAFMAQLQQTAAIEQWFFIRYADPDPHVRLRMQGVPGDLLSGILPLLTAWGQSLLDADLIRKLVLDT